MSRAAKTPGVATLALARQNRQPVASKDFLSILDLSHDELERVLDLAADDEARPRRGPPGAQPLAGKHVALLFEKPSLRTRTTFVIAVRELGGEVIEPPADVALGGRESVEDVARNLERWVAGAIVRTFAQERLDAFAARRAAICTSSTRSPTKSIRVRRSPTC